MSTLKIEHIANIANSGPDVSIDTNGHLNIVNGSLQMGGTTMLDTSDTTLKNVSKIGIGTATPTALQQNYLDSGSLNLGLRLTQNNSGQGIWMEFQPGNNTDDWQVGANNSGFAIYNATDSRYDMVIKGDGNLGIGTDNPSTKLHVDGGGSQPELRVSQNSTYFTDIGVNHIDVNGPNDLRFLMGGAQKARLTSGGVLALGSGTPGSWSANYPALTIGQGATLTGHASNTQTQLGQNWWIGTGNQYIVNGAASRLVMNPDSTIIFSQAPSGTANATMSTTNDRLVINPSGNVGIGVSSPFADLTVGTSTAFDNGDNYITAVFQPAINGSESAGMLFGHYPASGYAKQGIFWERYAGASGSGGRGKLHFVNRDATDTSVPTTADTRMTILESGYVGIGETSPMRLLHIQAKGTSTADNAAILLENEVGTTGEIRQGPASDNALLFTENGTERFRITSGGYVGISTNNPATAFHVYTASGNAYHKLEANASGTRSANIYWAKKTDGSTLRGYVGTTGDANKMEVATSTNDDIHFYTNNDPTNKGIMLKADGKVGVAVTSPGAQFSVSGPASLVNLGGGATGSAALYINSTSGHTGELFQLLKNGSEKMQMDNDGRLGIGTNNPGFYLHVVGGTRFAGSENATHGQVSVHGTSGGDAQIAFVTDSNGRAIYVDNNDTNKMKFSTGYGKGVAGKEIVMDNNAQLGIGTTSPATQLHVHNSSGNGSVQITSQAGATSYINMGDVDDADIGQISYVNSDDSMRFKAGTGERMRINGTGIVNFLQDGSSATQVYTSAGYTQTYIFRFAMNMTGNTAYTIRMTGFGHGIIRVMAQASHWTGGYMTYRESMIGMDSYAGITETNLNYANSGAQGNWSFSRPSNGKFDIYKSAGSYGGGMLSTIIIIGPRNINIESIT